MEYVIKIYLTLIIGLSLFGTLKVECKNIREVRSVFIYQVLLSVSIMVIWFLMGVK